MNKLLPQNVCERHRLLPQNVRDRHRLLPKKLVLLLHMDDIFELIYNNTSNLSPGQIRGTFV
jgi:hypothetical protein